MLQLGKLLLIFIILEVLELFLLYADIFNIKFIKLNKCYKSNQIIIEHAHPVYQKTAADRLYVKNQSFFNSDKNIFTERQAKNFDL
jgi:hypothetical protein